MAPYHILTVKISSVIPENLVLLTKSEQYNPDPNLHISAPLFSLVQNPFTLTDFFTYH